MLTLEHKKTTSRDREVTRPAQQRHTLPPSSSPIIQRAPSCACGGSCPRCLAKSTLKIGAPDDAYEREADAAADRVMRMADGAGAVTSASAASGLQRKCAACEKESEEPILQPKAESSSASAPPSAGSMSAPSSVDAVLRTPGQALDSATRAFFEPRFGRDFSAVQVHSDSAAQQSARDVSAHAYTVGHHIVFDTGRFAPGTSEGRRLLSHELAHVVQQRGAVYMAQGMLSVGAANDRAEQQAHQAENMISAGLSQSTFGKIWNQARVAADAGNLTTASTLRRRINPNFVSCNPPSAAIAATTGPDPVSVITAANTRAIELLTNVIDELQFTRDSIVAGAEATSPTISDGVALMLMNRFHLDASNRNIWTRRGEGTVDVLIRRFRGARQILNDGAMRYQCLGGAAIDFTFGGVNCAGPGCVGATRAVSCEGVSQLVLCAPFWGDSADDQATTLMHECFHIYFGFIGDTGNLANAHCYEQFVADFNGIPVPAIFVGSCP